MFSWNGSNIQCNLNYPDLIYPEPRLSGLAGDQKIHYHACAEGMANDPVTGWTMSYGLCRIALAKIDWPELFSEHRWPWSCCIGIVYRLGIINQVRNVGTSVIQTISLTRYGSDQLVDKGVQIIKDALYYIWAYQDCTYVTCSYYKSWAIQFVYQAKCLWANCWLQLGYGWS